ncbi:hypothetical protein [Micromonospora sp. HM5-17]|uniref:hypothetical protein n=1 Tax=Micromonospora sp. HM5-17 TaxID=2487710 RepID=UPI0011CE7DB3|nr:hypothetical protein [Micromonospora sp. HM5-17]
MSGLLAALVLLTFAGHTIITAAGAEISIWHAGPSDLGDRLRFAGWAVVCAAILVGLRRSAAVLAWTAAVAEVVLLVSRFGADPVMAIGSLWRVAPTLIAAAALTVPAPSRRAVAVLRVWRLLPVVAALVLIDGIFLLNKLGEPTLYVHAPSLNAQRGDGSFGLSASSELVVALYAAGVVVAVLTLVVTVATLAAPLRRRLAVLFVPVAALVVLADAALGDWAFSPQQLEHPLFRVPALFVALVGVPAAIFAAGVLLVRHR